MRAKMLCALLIATLFTWAGVAGAQTIPASSQFDVTGFIQAATLDSQATTTDATCKSHLILCGGSITVNHQKITVPSNTILQMPAAALTWQQVFANSPAPYTGSQSGLASGDSPRPFGTYEAHVVGNRVGGEYIAGLIFLSQNSLQSSQGYINFIDYSTGTFRVGGTIGSATSGKRVRINDPEGKFAPAFTPDSRFTIDENNPTVRSDTGYPMCIARAVPPPPPTPGTAVVETDPLCPSVNRPVDPSSASGFAMVITMNTPAAVDDPANKNSNLPDPRLMAPLEVGDFVTYSGVLAKDATGTYVAAYQVIANVGLYTTAGVDPAYVATDVMLLGVGGNTVAGLAEATTRTRFEGFSTDPSRNIVLSGIDVDACSGASSLRNWGSIGVDQGLPAGAVLGRWRFRPPCKGTSLTDVTDKVCLGPAGNSFLPATREMRSSIENVKGSGTPATPFKTKNNLNAGFYQAPIFEFLFPENAAVGSPVVPNNFEDMPFLALGSGPLDPSQPASATNPIVGQLSPWPTGFTAPDTPPSCANAPAVAPLANAGPAQTVAINAAVTLTGAASTDPNSPPLALTYSWIQTAGPAVTLSSATAVSPTFKAPATPTSLTFSLKVTNTASLSSTATVTITVNGTPVANAGTNQNVASGALVTLNGSASTDAGAPPLTYAWTKTSGPAVTLKNPTTVNPTFTAPTVAAGSPSVVFTFSLVVKNAAGATSAPSTVTVTVAPGKDTITISTVEYRTGKQRLTVDATSSAQNGAAPPTLSMQAFDAAGKALGKAQPMPFSASLALYEVIVVGAQQPTTVKVTSSLGGTATSPLTKLRQ